jgi:hypothetical protein
MYQTAVAAVLFRVKKCKGLPFDAPTGVGSRELYSMARISITRLIGSGSADAPTYRTFPKNVCEGLDCLHRGEIA